MIEDMQVRNFPPHTQNSYVQQASLFARHFSKSPEVLGPEEIRSYQVYLRTPNLIKGLAPGGDIHELFVSVGGPWSHADLTQLAGAPPENNAFPVIAGFEWEAGGTKQVVYRPADGHIHELFVSVGGSWDHADLTQMTGAPLPDFASAYACFAWKAGGSKQVVYLTADGHIHELFVSVGGSWSHADLTQITGAPLPQPDTAFTGYEWEAGGTKQVVFLTANGHIHELFVSVEGSWSHADLTQMTGAPPVA